MTIYEYFYNKFLEWQYKGNGDYKAYIKNAGRNGLKQEFLNDKKFKSEVCEFLKKYAETQERQNITDAALSVIESTAIEATGEIPVIDVINIVVGAVLDACGYTKTGNKLLVETILVLIISGAIAFLIYSLSKK